MSVGAICFTSSGSNGGCRVVLVIFLVNLFFSEKGFFFSYETYTPPKKCTRVMQKKMVKNAIYANRKSVSHLRQKKDTTYALFRN